MLKLFKSALVALLGLGMASVMAQTDPRFGAFMQTVAGNSTTVKFGGGGVPVATSAAPLGTPSVQAMGFTRTAEGVFMESNGFARVPGSTVTVPVSTKLKLSSAVIGKTLAKAAMLYTAWEAGSALYDIWADTSVNKNRLPGQPVQPQTFTHQARIRPDNYSYPVKYLSPTRITVVYGYGNDFASARSALISSAGASSCQQVWQIYKETYGWTYGYPGFSSLSVNTSFPNSELTCSFSNGQTLPLPFSVASGSYSVTPPAETPYTEQELSDLIAQQSGWPDSTITSAMRDALNLPGVQPYVAPDIEAQPATQTQVQIQGAPNGATIGDPVTTETTTTNPDGTTSTTTKTTTTTVTPDGNKLVKTQDTVTTVTVKDAQGNPISTTTTTTTTPQTPTTAAEGEDLECGLPDTPACRIDETGTPETVPELEDPQQQADDVYKPLADIVEDPESFWPELPEFNWSFQLPTGCGILNVPAFEPFLTGIDVCQFQPMFHDIMSVVWVMGGLLGAIGLFWRNTMATQ